IGSRRTALHRGGNLAHPGGRDAAHRILRVDGDMAVLNRRATGASGWNLRYIWFISMAAAMGGLLFGYDWVVIGGAKPFYETFFHLRTPAAVAWAMSSALIGCLFGAVASGMLSDRFGRKRLLVLAASCSLSVRLEQERRAPS